jgi:hypothetical protein
MPEVNDDGPGIFLLRGSHRLPAMRERSAQQYEVIGEIIAHMGAHITLSAATDDPGQLIFRMEMIRRKEAGFLEFPDKEGCLIRDPDRFKSGFNISIFLPDTP